MNVRPSYVVDTNIIVDYVDIIPNGDDAMLDHPTIDLTGAHLIIPTAVIRELSSFKGESSDRGRAAREALRRLRKIFATAGLKLPECYQLNHPVRVHEGNRYISVLPVNRHLPDALPFRPSDKDMDGQIIMASLSALLLENNLPADGTPFESLSALGKLDQEKIVLLTNDNGLAIRASARGIKTSRFGYRLPAPYTGRRLIPVSDEFLFNFIQEKELPLSVFDTYFPLERPLVANEYLEFYPESGVFPEDYPEDEFFHVGRFDSEEKVIHALRNLYRFPLPIRNVGQAIYADALMDPTIACVICTGPAGSGKTFMSTVYCLETCRNNPHFIGICIVPCNVQDDNLGALPGDLDAKLDPNVQPIKNALKNYLLQTTKPPTSAKKSMKKYISDEVDQLWENWFENIPINYARGRDFNRELAIFDEFQDQNRSQANTLLTRIGQGGKIIVTGDIEQIHAAYLDRDSNGLTFARQLLMDNPQVAQVTFVEEEVVRHPLVKLITQRQRAAHSSNSDPHPD